MPARFAARAKSTPNLSSLSRMRNRGPSPNGVAFKDGALYVAENSRISRYDGVLDFAKVAGGAGPAPKPTVLTDKLPPDRMPAKRVPLVRRDLPGGVRVQGRRCDRIDSLKLKKTHFSTQRAILAKARLLRR